MGEKEGISCRRLRKVALSAELTVSHQRCMCGMYRMLGAVLFASQNSWMRIKVHIGYNKKPPSFYNMV